MKNVKNARHGRIGIITKLNWIHEIADALEQKAVADKKSHKKIRLSSIYVNALVAHVSDVVLKSGDDDLPALNILFAKHAYGIRKENHEKHVHSKR